VIWCNTTRASHAPLITVVRRRRVSLGLRSSDQRCASSTRSACLSTDVSNPDFDRISDLLAADRKANRGTGPTWAVLNERSAREIWALMRRIKRDHPATFGLYGSDHELFVAAVEAFEVEDRAPMNMESLSDALRIAATQEWLIS